MSFTSIPTIAVKVLPPEPLKVLLILKTLTTYTHNRPEFEFNGNEYRLKFGQLVTTYELLADRVGIEIIQVKAIIQLFNKITLIEILQDSNLLIQYKEQNVSKLRPDHTRKIIELLSQTDYSETINSIIAEYRNHCSRIPSTRQIRESRKAIKQAFVEGWTPDQVKQQIPKIKVLGERFKQMDIFFEDLEKVKMYAND